MIWSCAACTGAPARYSPFSATNCDTVSGVLITTRPNVSSIASVSDVAVACAQFTMDTLPRSGRARAATNLTNPFLTSRLTSSSAQANSASLCFAFKETPFFCFKTSVFCMIVTSLHSTTVTK
jgi:hypothetical protein